MHCHQPYQFLGNVFWIQNCFTSVCEAVMCIILYINNNLCFIHETEKQKHFWPSSCLGDISMGPAFFASPSLSTSCRYGSPSLWWLSQYFGAGAFSRMQVIRDVFYTCEIKAMWKLCLRFHLLLKLNTAIRQVVIYSTFYWGFEELRWAVADNQHMQLDCHSDHAFSILLTASPLPSVFLVIIIS